MAYPPSPFAPADFPALPPVPGVRLAACEAGVRYSGRLDLMLAEFAPDTVVGGVMTKSTTAGAPVDWNRIALGNGAARALVVNAGNANVFTGERGRDAVEKTAAAVSGAIDCGLNDVFVCSTGTIGEYLLEERITAKIGDLTATLSDTAWENAATAIMTTDTYPKGAVRTTAIDGTPVTLVGIAKGSGMIAPDMATMLAYVMTDAVLSPGVAQAAVADGADKSFNAITIDSDTSTSDTLLLFATGQAGHAPVSEVGDERLTDFKDALNDLLIDMAHQVVKDGEGAQKFIEIRVAGAESDDAARRIGLAVGNSPLVKTAIAGEDANWGRIVMAVGKAGEKADRDKLAIAIGGVQITQDGEPVPNYDETPVTTHMQGHDIEIEIDVGVGKGQATTWTCDLTHGYIDINADYRT
ncbi:MAG: bifunctional glutamate N-acetyltransferase/amino-acid acetyltransferase ArgJ [Alphaproteobacteria bacterium]|nr:bifunctional glutamate N-acetyltransferase/amino-acid acetyltransferase ArgJ [Alphaproteobacteria bacterium]